MNELDTQIFRALNHALGGFWLTPMLALSAIGGGWGALLVLPFLGWTRTRAYALSLAGVLGVTATLVFGIKRLVARVRPCGCLEDVKVIIEHAPTDYSFPSGHAAGSFAFTVFLAVLLVRTLPRDASRAARFLRRLAACVLVAIAVGVALSRIALGVHFPGDVMAGAILGSTVAILGAQRHWPRRASVSHPSADRGA